MNIPAGTKELTDYGITLTAAQINDAEQQSNKNQPNGYAGVDADGAIVGKLILRKDTAANLASVLLSSGEMAYATDTRQLFVGDGSTLGGVSAGTLNSDASVVVKRGTTDTASAANLRTAVAYAATMTPGGNALSATNRATVLIPPGRYDFGTGDASNHGLELTTEFVDVIGLGACPSDTVLTSAIANGRGTVETVYSDNAIAKLRIEVTATGPRAALINIGGLVQTGIRRDCEFVATGTAFPTYGPGGVFYRCKAIGNSAFANKTSCYDCTATGDRAFSEGYSDYGSTYERCTAEGDYAFASGYNIVMRDCVVRGDHTLDEGYGTLERCSVTATGTNQTALMTDINTIIGGSYIGTGTGKSIDAASDNTQVEISNCYTPQGIGKNVSITNIDARKPIELLVVSPTEDVATGDGAAYFTIPAQLNGRNLVAVHARVITAGTTGTTDIQVANVTDSVDMLSTKLTIDSAETGSDTAATAAVIDTTKDDVATNDLIRIDIDAVSTTAPKGLIVRLEFA